MIVASITLTAPTGSAWAFLLLFAVVIVGPPIVQRARVPGLIGLLLGGFVIGPHGFDLVSAGSTTIPDLGQLGLLYLMFVAGVEIDLAPVQGSPGERVRRALDHAFFDAGIMIRPAGDTIELTPPLILSENDIGEIMDKVAASIKAAA